MAVFGKGQVWAALAALLLAGSQSNAQNCEDCNGEFPASVPRFVDDLAPEMSVFAHPRNTLRNRFVASELDRALDLNRWSVKIVGVSEGLDVPDFAIALQYPASDRKAMTQIVGASLAVSSNYYELLSDARTPYRYDSLDFERRDDAYRRMSIAEYGNTEPSAADDEAVARVKTRINAQLQSSSVKKCSAAIDNRLATRVQDTMKRTLARAHYVQRSEVIYAADDAKRSGYHPFNFHFEADYSAAGGSGGQLAGTRPALMIEAAMAMREFCQTNDRKYLVALGQALDGLEKKLPKED